MCVHTQHVGVVCRFRTSQIPLTKPPCTQVEHTVTEEVTGIDIVQVSAAWASGPAETHLKLLHPARPSKIAQLLPQKNRHWYNSTNLQSQIKIAGGATLGSMGIGTQEDVGEPLGYALQCRITAEDPAANFQARIQLNLLSFHAVHHAPKLLANEFAVQLEFLRKSCLSIHCVQPRLMRQGPASWRVIS